MTEKLNVFAVRTLTQKEYFAPGHRSCQGCAEALAVRLVAKALGRNVIVANATGCMEIVSSPLPFTSWRVPWFHVAFENAAAVASGIESGLKVLMRKGRIPHKEDRDRCHGRRRRDGGHRAAGALRGPGAGP